MAIKCHKAYQDFHQDHKLNAVLEDRKSPFKHPQLFIITKTGAIQNPLNGLQRKMQLMPLLAVVWQP